MNRYIHSIIVHQIFHLKDVTIQVNVTAPHLILTGKNGSGKTILLNAIAEFLNNIRNDKSLHNDFNHVLGKVSLDIPLNFDISKQHQDGDFIFAFYGAMRDTKMHEPKNPTKPRINKNPDIKHSSTDQFLNFLSDLKIQEALARNENQISDADSIKDWFVSFEQLLCELYEDPELHLDFNYKDYSFRIITAGKSFKFTELSDGFTAAIDIIADLILKMQEKDAITRTYNKPGIVIIDEIETHLHLSLQRNILKILTRVFPKIQFIVSTHSPFVLCSLDNATAFDLEQRKSISDLSDYSYESIAEGYFGIHTESSYIGNKLEQLKKLLSKDVLAPNEERQKQNLIEEFNNLPEMVSPLYVGEFRQLMITRSSK